MPLKGNEGPSLTCWRCGVAVWPRVGMYWFLLLAPRGRCKLPGGFATESVLCPGCGRRAQEALEQAGVTGQDFHPAGSQAKRFMTGP